MKASVDVMTLVGSKWDKKSNGFRVFCVFVCCKSWLISLLQTW